MSPLLITCVIYSFSSIKVPVVRCVEAAGRLLQSQFLLSHEEIDAILSSTVFDSKKTSLKSKLLLDSNTTVCVNATTVANTLGLSFVAGNTLPVTLDQFKSICSYAIQNSLIHGCNSQHTSSTDRFFIALHPGKAWGFALLSATIINLCSVNGALLYPLMRRKSFQKVVMFLVALASGVLLSNGLLQLLPNSLGLDPALDNSHILKLVCVLAGVYTFIVFELLLKSCVAWKRGFEVPDLAESCCRSLAHLNVINPGGPLTDPFRLKPQSATSIEPQDQKLAESDTTEGRSSAIHTVLVQPAHMGSLTFSDSVMCVGQKKTKNRFFDPVCFEPRISSVACLIIIGDMLHNFVDGLALGSSFSESAGQGISISLAVFSEEFPHELGDFAALVSSGMTLSQALFWNLMASLSCYFGCALGLAVGAQHSVTQYIDAFCAGMFIYISLVAMLPEVVQKIILHSEGKRAKYVANLAISLLGVLLGMCFMVLISYTSYKIQLGQ